MNYVYKFISTPVGKLTLIATEKGLAAVLWENDNPGRVHAKAITENNNDPILLAAEQQLQEYFDGKRSSFSLPLDLIGTEFQQQVWNALATIPYGETRNYTQIAEQIGNPKAVRAVGAANGKNPISIILPCHRVIGASGDLTGFAGGLATKAHLLTMEGAKSSKIQMEIFQAESVGL
jgi:methylated-DNA-[protein]-cysteine S-methyltransferase